MYYFASLRYITMIHEIDINFNSNLIYIQKTHFEQCFLLTPLPLFLFTLVTHAMKNYNCMFYAQCYVV